MTENNHLAEFRKVIANQRKPLPRVPEDEWDNVVVHAEDIQWYSPGKESNPSRLGPVLQLPVKSFEIFLQEIEAGSASDMQRHHHESVHYIMSGTGYSEIGDKTYHWSEGDFVYTPPMVWHRHYNKSKEEPVRMFLVENSKLLEHFGLNYRESEGSIDYAELKKRLNKKNSEISI